MISVVIPLYNKGNHIHQTLKTVLAQSYIDFEVIIVDDGSQDNGPEIAENFHDPRIRLVHQANAGVSAARNRGIAEARGEFIAFLDADDEWKPDYLLTQYNLTKKYTDCDIFATDYIFRYSNGKEKNTIIRKLCLPGEDGVLDNYFEIASVSHPPLWTSVVVVSKRAINSIGGFPIGVASGEDLLTWARLVCKFKFAYTKQICAIYNLGDGYDYTKTPPRRQDVGDPVGKGLKDLYNNHKRIKGLKSYLSRWHKMRASVALRYFDRGETLREAFLSLKYNLLQRETYPFIILPLLPSSAIRYILKKKSSF